MGTAGNIILIILIVVVAVLAFLYWFSGRVQKKQLEQQKFMDANSQTVTMLIIDKKRMKLQDAPLPKAALESAPWYSKLMKTDVVKAKIGPRIVTLMSDANVFKMLPEKGGSCKVKVSGLYITAIISGAVLTEEEIKKRKKLKAKEAKKAAKLAAKSSK